MATPKKKVSRSRRNMRRFSAAYKLDPVTLSTDEAGQTVRSHRVASPASVSAYVQARATRKATRKGASAAPSV